MADNSFVWAVIDPNGKLQSMFYRFESAQESLIDPIQMKKTQVSDNVWVFALGQQKWKIVKIQISDANKI